MKNDIAEERRLSDDQHRSFVENDRVDKLRRHDEHNKANVVMLGDGDEALTKTLSLLQPGHGVEASASATEVAAEQEQGGGGAAASATGLAAPQSQAAHNAFLQFISQREVPQALPLENTTRSADGMAGVTADMRRLGNIDWLERNRSELRAGIKCCR